MLPTLVARLVPPGVEVEAAHTLADASRRLREQPPEAMIVNLCPASVPWQELRHLCESHNPCIPVLYESCVFKSPADAGLGQLNRCGHFLMEPYTIAELRSELGWLVHEAENSCNQRGGDEQGGNGPPHLRTRPSAASRTA